MKYIESLSKNIANFRNDTLYIEQFLTGTLVSYNFFKDQYPEISKEFKNKERNREEIEGMSIFEKLNLEISNYEENIYTFCFINLIARTEAFLNDILETLYLWKEKESASELDMEKRKKTILNFSHSSFKEKIEFLKNKFELNFSLIEEHNSTIIEFFSTRNILLHNNGYVNATYLKYNKDSQLTIGTKRIINREYLQLTIVLVIIIAKSIEEKTKELMTHANC